SMSHALMISGHLPDDFLFAAAVVSRDEPIHKRGAHARRTYAVTTDVLLDVVDRNRLGHREHRALRHRVREPFGDAHERNNRCHVEDDAASLADHDADRRLAAQVNTLDVYLIEP